MLPRRDQRLGVEATAIRGVLTEPRFTPVPAGPPWLLGVCLAEGRVVSVLDLLPAPEEPGPARPPRVVVLLTTPAGLVGIAADGPPVETEDTEGSVDFVIDAGLLPERIAAAMAGPDLGPG